jgi:hypothetical protein
MRYTVPAEYDSDLFGTPATPRDARIPSRGTGAYLPHLHSLPLPDGLEFWSLSKEPIPKRAPNWVESVYCIDQQRKWRHLLIDIRNGEVHTAEEWSEE